MDRAALQRRAIGRKDQNACAITNRPRHHDRNAAPATNLVEHAAGLDAEELEAVHYRAAPHATADDPRAYIDPVRVEDARAHECVGSYETFLRRLGLLDDDLVAAAHHEAEDLMRAGIAAAEAEPPADPSLVFEHAYADPPPEIRRFLS